MTVNDYAWINDSAIGEAGCVTVVPAADRQAVLAAFGAIESSARPDQSLDTLEMDGGSASAPIYVADVGDARVIIENNGFQGSRFEVLQPVSKASGALVASSFFWNVNALTAFSAARRGKLVFSVELIGSEDDELDGVPKRLRPLVIEGGSEDADMEAAGLALVARFTKVDFTEAAVSVGTTYDIEPPSSGLQTHYPDDTDLFDLDNVGHELAALSSSQQRQLAEWATTAAVIDADIADEPAVGQVLTQMGTGEPLTLPPTIDVLARAAAKKQFHFNDLEEAFEEDDLDEVPSHPYYEAVAEGRFGESRAISRLEGAYLAQRRWAFEAVRYVAHPDSYSAAVGCLNAADLTFSCGRLSRGWTYTETDSGRRLSGFEANPRRQEFVAAATALMAGVAGPDPEQAIARATAALPTPLTSEERTAAIHADALAAAKGAFAEYQVDRADPVEVVDFEVTGEWTQSTFDD